MKTKKRDFKFTVIMLVLMMLVQIIVGGWAPAYAGDGQAVEGGSVEAAAGSLSSGDGDGSQEESAGETGEQSDAGSAVETPTDPAAGDTSASEAGDVPALEDTLENALGNGTFTFDVQPATQQEVQEAIDVYEAALQGALDSGDFSAALAVSKPRWENQVDSSLMPIGWRCDVVEEEIDGIIVTYWTFFPAPMLMGMTLPASDETTLRNAINSAVDGDCIEILNSFSIAGVITVPTGKDLTIQSAAGGTYTLTATASRHFAIQGKLTIENIVLVGGNTGGGVYVDGGTVTMNSGAVIKNCRAEYGGAVHVVNNGEFVMEDGEIRENEATNSGGGLYFANNTIGFTMKDGLITENKATGTASSGGGFGGGVLMGQNTTFRMKDGLISENEAAFRGGGVYMHNGKFIMSGSSGISGNSAKNGGGVSVLGNYAANKGDFTIEGAASITGNTAENGGGVHMDGGAFTMSGSSQISNNKAISDSSQTVGGGVWISSKFTMEDGTISGNEADIGGGVYAGDEFTMKDGEISNNEADIGGGVWVSSKFTMAKGEIRGNTAKRYGGGVNVTNAQFFMEGGTISENVAKQYEGGGVNMNDSSTFTMTKGEIRGNTAKRYGGGVNVHYSNFKMNGGTISGNTAETGGGVHVYAATLTMDGSEISENRAESGGGICARGTLYASNSKLTITNSKINGNFANAVGTTAETANGGGIYADSDVEVLIKGSEINSNETNKNATAFNTGYGGGIYAAKNADLTIEDSSIEDNKAKAGGGIFAGHTTDNGVSVSIMIKNSHIDGNETLNGGGGIFASNHGTVTITGGSISGNTANNAGGGGIVAYLDNLNITGSAISDNTTNGIGGGIMGSTGNIIIDSTTISGNKTTNSSGGGGIGLYGGAELTLQNGCVIENNTAPNGHGGGIYTSVVNYTNLLLIAGDTVFSGNTAKELRQPPANAGALYPKIKTTSSSVQGFHPLNNYDINYAGTLLHIITERYLDNQTSQPIPGYGETQKYVAQGQKYRTTIPTIPGYLPSSTTAGLTKIDDYNYESTSTITSSRTFTFRYGPLHSVTFNKNHSDTGGFTEASPQSLSNTTPGGNVGTLPTPPSRTGYDFLGWTMNSDGSGGAFTASTSVNSSITVYGQWQLKEYALHFDANAGGATVTGIPAVPRTVQHGVAVGQLPGEGLLPAPARSGFDFLGWSLNAGSATADFTGSSSITQNETIFALWQPQWVPGPVSVTVEYYQYGAGQTAAQAVNTGTDVLSHVYNQPFNYPAGYETKYPGYTFRSADPALPTGPLTSDTTVKLYYQKTSSPVVPVYTITVKHYTYGPDQTISDGVLQDTVSQSRNRGDSFTAVLKDYSGYAFQPAVSDSLTIASIDSDTTIKLYYQEVLAYQLQTVKYLELDCNDRYPALVSRALPWDDFVQLLEAKTLDASGQVVTVPFASLTSSDYAGLDYGTITLDGPLQQVTVTAEWANGQKESKAVEVKIVDRVKPEVHIPADPIFRYAINGAHPTTELELVAELGQKGVYTFDNYDGTTILYLSYHGLSGFDQIRWDRDNEYIVYLDTVDQSGNRAVKRQAIILLIGDGGSSGGDGDGGNNGGDGGGNNGGAGGNNLGPDGTSIDNPDIPLGGYVLDPDGNWVYMEEGQIPRGKLPQTGGTWLRDMALLGAAASILLLISQAIRIRKKKQVH